MHKYDLMGHVLVVRAAFCGAPIKPSDLHKSLKALAGEQGTRVLKEARRVDRLLSRA